MQSATIMAAIGAASAAIDAVAKIKEKFFSGKGDTDKDGPHTESLRPSIEALREEVSQLKQQQAAALAQLEEQHQVLEKQNEILAELSGALKTTAEQVESQRVDLERLEVALAGLRESERKSAAVATYLKALAGSSLVVAVLALVIAVLR